VEETGSPHTIVVAAAGIRAADLTRYHLPKKLQSRTSANTGFRPLRAFQSKSGKVAKLFAKHIKLKEAVEDCQKNRCVAKATCNHTFHVF